VGERDNLRLDDLHDYDIDHADDQSDRHYYVHDNDDDPDGHHVAHNHIHHLRRPSRRPPPRSAQRRRRPPPPPPSITSTTVWTADTTSLSVPTGVTAVAAPAGPEPTMTASRRSTNALS